MPRRLGDDPLTRAKRQAAKTATVPSPADTDSGTPQIISLPSSSYNDVFFQRRTSEDASSVASEPQQVVAGAPERREISEISEIPEIREVASLPEVHDYPAVAQIQVDHSAEPAEQVQVRPAETPVALENVAPVVDQAAQAAQVSQEPQEKASPSPAPLPSAKTEGAPEHEKNGGFFKRVFGKFRK